MRRLPPVLFFIDWELFYSEKLAFGPYLHIDNGQIGKPQSLQVSGPCQGVVVLIVEDLYVGDDWTSLQKK